MNYASIINHKSEIINHKSIGSTSSQRRHYDRKGRFVCISWRVCTYGNRKVPDWGTTRVICKRQYRLQPGGCLKKYSLNRLPLPRLSN